MQVHDLKTRITVLIGGMKSVLWSLTTFNTPMINQMGPVLDTSSHSLKEEEIRLASKGIASAIPCLRIFAWGGRDARELSCYDIMSDMISVVQVSFLPLSLCWSVWASNHSSICQMHTHQHLRFNYHHNYLWKNSMPRSLHHASQYLAFCIMSLKDSALRINWLAQLATNNDILLKTFKIMLQYFNF